MTYTLTGKYVHGNGTGRVGSLAFEPTATVLGADSIILRAPLTVNLDSTGAFSVDLVGTDDPAYAPSDWLWQVTEMLPGGRAPWTFELTTDANIADLT